MYLNRFGPRAPFLPPTCTSASKPPIFPFRGQPETRLGGMASPLVSFADTPGKPIFDPAYWVLLFLHPVGQVEPGGLKHRKACHSRLIGKLRYLYAFQKGKSTKPLRVDLLYID